MKIPKICKKGKHLKAKPYIKCKVGLLELPNCEAGIKPECR